MPVTVFSDRVIIRSNRPHELPHNVSAVTEKDKRVASQRAPMAQLLLLARLRARNSRDLARDLLERAAHVIFVTCRSWLSGSRDAAPKTGKPHPESTDAHRHD